MKFGMCAPLPDLEKALAAGADYIEVNNARLVEMSDEDFEKHLAIAKQHPGSVLASNGFFLPEITLTGEHQSPDIRSFIETSISRLARLGVETIVFGSGKARNCPEGFPMEKALEQVAEVTAMIADIGKPYGMVSIVEPLYKKECNVINKVAASCAAAKAANRENCKGLVDLFHFMNEAERLSELLPLVPQLGHVHICSSARKMPYADDCTNYKAFLDTLREGGYDGKISFEGAIPKDWDLVAGYFRFIRSL